MCVHYCVPICCREKRQQQLVAVAESEQTALERKRQKKERITEREAGPVTVKILDDKITAMPSGKARRSASTRRRGTTLHDIHTCSEVMLD